MTVVYVAFRWIVMEMCWIERKLEEACSWHGVNGVCAQHQSLRVTTVVQLNCRHLAFIPTARKVIWY